jgi:hypothetical protein
MLQSEIYAKDAVQFSGIAHQNRPRQNDSIVAYTLVLRRSSRTDRCTKQEMPKRGNPPATSVADWPERLRSEERDIPDEGKQQDRSRKLAPFQGKLPRKRLSGTVRRPGNGCSRSHSTHKAEVVWSKLLSLNDPEAGDFTLA